MKNIIIFLFTLIPVSLFAQTKIKRPKRHHIKNIYIHNTQSSEKEQEQEQDVFYEYTSGEYLTRAAQDYNTGIFFTIIGGGLGVILATQDKDNQAAGIAVAAVGVAAGLIFNLMGNSQIKKAGETMRQSKLSFTGTGLSYSF